MSGTNVWLKLRASAIYEPHPFLLDTDGSVWRLPYQLTLNHTVEEISQNCAAYAQAEKRFAMFEERARLHLGLTAPKDVREFFEPEHLTMEEFLRQSPYVFDALHGGAGEDGTLQSVLSKRAIPYNGPDADASRLCIDKWETAERIRTRSISGVDAIRGKMTGTKELLAMEEAAVKRFWSETRRELRSESLIVKPRGDGCSTGIVHLYGSSDLTTYLDIMRRSVLRVPRGTFRNQEELIEMPPETPSHLIFERFIETDVLRVKGNRLKHRRVSGMVEITVGVVARLPSGGGRLHAFNPSITVAEGEVLSVEEKFQGGTGVNLTPPPPSVMLPSVVKKIRARIETLAKELGITGYSRIDAFANTKTGALLIIEVNTLPGLTPSTVLYHQALAEKPPVFPRELLEMLIKNKNY